MEYLYNFGLDDSDIEKIKENTSDEVYSDLTLFDH